MGCASRGQYLLKRPDMIPVAVSGQHVRNAHPSGFGHGKEGVGLGGGVDKQALVAGADQVAVVVHLGDGDVFELEGIHSAQQ